MNILEKHFSKIGARVKTVPARRWERNDLTIDVKQDKNGEYFEFAMRKPVEFKILQTDRDAKHALILDDEGHRFLCGHDERHWFVAGIADRVSTVAAAKQSLMPKAVREQVAQMSPDEYDNRSNRAFKRQGEWFFVPVRKDIGNGYVLRQEPLQKTPRNKPHWCEELFRQGGETVYVVRNRVMNQEEYEKHVLDHPGERSLMRTMVRNPDVYVRGYVRHADHSTVHLEGWHRVFMNAEFTTSQVAFLD